MRFNKFILNIPILPILFLIVVLYLAYTIYNKSKEGFDTLCPVGTLATCSVDHALKNNKCYNCKESQTLVVNAATTTCDMKHIAAGTAPKCIAIPQMHPVRPLSDNNALRRSSH